MGQTLFNMGREQRIKELLDTSINISKLIVINESYRHSVPEDAETHFKISIVSQEFSGLSLVKTSSKN